MPAKRHPPPEQYGKCRVKLHVGVELLEQRVDVPKVVSVDPAFKSSTFSCDIAYSDSPTAAKASPRSVKVCQPAISSLTDVNDPCSGHFQLHRRWYVRMPANDRRPAVGFLPAESPPRPRRRSPSWELSARPTSGPPRYALCRHLPRGSPRNGIDFNVLAVESEVRSEYRLLPTPTALRTSSKCLIPRHRPRSIPQAQESA